ncbi:MAG: hypothetical protein GXP62_06615 [Oligoflexia bacterium]|nr:hypothetical protein [Oligoflexia bacterium]
MASSVGELSLVARAALVLALAMVLALVLALFQPATALACGASCPIDESGTFAAAGVAGGLIWGVWKLKVWLF